MNRTAFEAKMDKRAAVRQAEADGSIADSLDIRLKLMERVRAGEITLEVAQKELRNIQRTAKASGKATRAQVFNGA